MFSQGEFKPRGYTDKDTVCPTSLDVLVEKFQLISGKPPETQEAATSPT